MGYFFLKINKWDIEGQKWLINTLVLEHKLGNQFQVISNGDTHSCVVVEKPFYDPKKKIANS